jgi:hypothetical protein
MALPVSAANGPPPPPQPFSGPGVFPFLEIGMVVSIDGTTSGTYVAHIVTPANGRDNAEESWIQFNGGGAGMISFPALSLNMPFQVLPGTTFKITVHAQKNQAIITLRSSAPLMVGGVSDDPFTTAQIRISPYGLEVIHPK